MAMVSSVPIRFFTGYMGGTCTTLVVLFPNRMGREVSTTPLHLNTTEYLLAIVSTAYLYWIATDL